MWWPSFNWTWVLPPAPPPLYIHQLGKVEKRKRGGTYCWAPPFPLFSINKHSSINLETILTWPACQPVTLPIHPAGKKTEERKAGYHLSMSSGQSVQQPPSCSLCILWLLGLHHSLCSEVISGITVAALQQRSRSEGSSLATGFEPVSCILLFIFWPQHEACRILVPWPGSELALPLWWKYRALTSGPPANSPAAPYWDLY